MGWLITRDPNGGFTRVFAHGLGLPLMDVVLDLSKINTPVQKPPFVTARQVSRSELRRRETIKRNETMRSLFENGLAISDIAARFKIAEKTAYQIVARGHQTRKMGRGANLTPENQTRRDEMRALFAEGKTKEEIGKIYGISRERVRQIIGNGLSIAKKVRHEKIKAQAAQLAETYTASEAAEILNISVGLLWEIAPGNRFKISDENPNSSVAKGDKWENIISEKLNLMGMENELMPHHHPFDILVKERVRIDVKSRHSFTTDSKGYQGYTFNIRKVDNADFVILVITETETYFIIPLSKKTSHSIRIQVDPKRSSKYEQYRNNWNLIERFLSGEAVETTDKQHKGERRHGTKYNYGLGCRCELCTEAMRIAQKTRNENRNDRIIPFKSRSKTGLVHGTLNGYQYYKCRCDACKKAVSEYAKERYKKRTTPAPSA